MVVVSYSQPLGVCAEYRRCARKVRGGEGGSSERILERGLDECVGEPPKRLVAPGDARVGRGERGVHE